MEAQTQTEKEKDEEVKYEIQTVREDGVKLFKIKCTEKGAIVGTFDNKDRANEYLEILMKRSDEIGAD